MKLDEYQSNAKAIAIYPGELVYPALGLCGEVGELIHAISHDAEEVVKEAGDVLWYIANVASDAGLVLSEVVGRKTFPKDIDCWRLSTTKCDLSIQAGVVAEHVKKTLRDDAGVLCDKRRKGIKKDLKEIVDLLAKVCGFENTTLEDCAEKNIAKLLSRQERGKLTGDGDDR
jgi:hypothetical protein